MDSARTICYVLRKLEQNRGETIRLDLRELAAIRPEDILVEIAKLNGTPTESPSLELPKPPNHTGPARRHVELSLRHCGGSHQAVSKTQDEQAHAPDAGRQPPSDMLQAPMGRLPVASGLELAGACSESSSGLDQARRATQPG